MSRSRWQRVAVLGAGAIVSALAWVAMPFGRPVDLLVTTAPISAGAIVRHITVNGTLMPMATVDVGAQIPGTVQSIEANFNDVVQPGQVLLRLDDGTLRAALQEARAARQRADADLASATHVAEEASQRLTRATELSAREVLAMVDLDAARTELVQAESGVQASEAALEQARAAVREATVSLGLTIIRAPVGGVVVERQVEVGVTVAPRSPVLFRVATDFTRLEVQADVDESDIAGIRSGQSATLDVSAYPDEVFRGRVAEVRFDAVDDAPAAETSAASTSRSAADAAPAALSYPVIITVDNADEKLRPGMAAVVSLEGPRRDGVVRIPNNALSFTPTPQILSAVAHSAGADGLERSPAAVAAAAEPLPHDVKRGATRAARVWEYDGTELTPVDVETGLADDSWTELVKGPIGPGIALVTHAQIVR